MPSLNKKFGQFSPDILARLKNAYLDNPSLSFEDLAARSAELVGQAISLERLKVYARTDPTGNWYVERNRKLGTGGGTDIVEEINFIRRMVFEQIMFSHTSGLLLCGDFDKDEVTEYLDAQFPSIDIVDIRPGGLDPALVNSYMGLLSKSKFDLNLTSSAKTSYEQALEIARKAVDGSVKSRSVAD